MSQVFSRRERGMGFGVERPDPNPQRSHEWLLWSLEYLAREMDQSDLADEKAILREAIGQVRKLKKGGG